MSRLITFGCSYTFGAGLEDVNGRHKGEPSKFAWPVLLGQLLDKHVVNEGECGSGNFEIFDKLIRYNFEPTDLVVIMWSHFVRLEHYRVDKNYNGSRTGIIERVGYFTDSIGFDNAYKNYQIFHHTYLYLESKKIPNYSFVSFPKDEQNFPCPNFFKFPTLLKIEESYHIDKALDDAHFGHKSHEKLANILYNKIK